jgi:TolB-like protein/tetratricopeptide (TPR) repeat protein
LLQPSSNERERGPDVDSVSAALARILASDVFDASPRSRGFLTYVVQEALAGRAGELSQFSIARRVFLRPQSFDPAVDPIVRIQAVRLRRSIERYYMGAGAEDPVRIDLPRGGYVPVLRWATAAERAAAARPASVGETDDWPVVIVEPFESQATPQDAAANITEELATELGHHQDVRVVLGKEAHWPASSSACFVLTGNVRGPTGARRVSVRLLDRTSRLQIWADEYDEPPGREDASSFEESVAQVVAAHVASEQGAVARTLGKDQRRLPLGDLGPYGALLRSYRFLSTREPAELLPAIEALRAAVARDPDHDLALVQLARLYAVNYAFEIAPIDTPIAEAVSLAQRGVHLEPTSRRARAVLALSLLVADEIEAARAEAERAVGLCPRSLVYLEALGFVLTLLGCWDRGREILDRAVARNPNHLSVVYLARWADQLRRGELDEAQRTAVEFPDSGYFWRALMLTASLGLLDRVAEAQRAAADLLIRKPDFPRRGRVLIGRLVKFPEVSRPILEGLERAGLSLA